MRKMSLKRWYAVAAFLMVFLTGGKYAWGEVLSPSAPEEMLPFVEMTFDAQTSFDFFSGPGKHYLRSAVKEAYAPGGVMQVFGMENGFVMVRMNMAENRSFIGFIAEWPMEYQHITALQFIRNAGKITRNTVLMDDFSGQGEAFTLLAEGAEVVHLARFEDFSYIEVAGAIPMRGFIKGEDVLVEAAPAGVSAEIETAAYHAVARVSEDESGLLSYQVTLTRVQGGSGALPSSYAVFLNHAPRGTVLAVGEDSGQTFMGRIPRDGAKTLAFFPVYDNLAPSMTEMMVLTLD